MKFTNTKMITQMITTSLNLKLLLPLYLHPKDPKWTSAHAPHSAHGPRGPRGPRTREMATAPPLEIVQAHLA